MISTTIKKEYMELILKGEKKVEYKATNKYWIKRIEGERIGQSMDDHKVINFLCGRKSYKFEIKKITVGFTPEYLKDIIKSIHCFKIHLGERIGE